MARRTWRLWALALAASVVIFVDSAEEDYEEIDDEGEDEQDGRNEEEPKIRIRHAKSTLRDLGWRDNDPVEVYNAEFLLASWVLDHAPWNAYHSGLAFTNNRTHEKVLFDYTPDNTSSVMRMIMPEVNLADDGIVGMLRGALLGDVSLTWRDGAHMEFYTYWPEQYTTFSRVGQLNGKLLFKFIDWVNDFYVPRYKAFNPVEIVVPSIGADGQENGTTALRSRMCHDFVTDSLWQLYENGAKLKKTKTLFRDHILMYAERAERVPAPEETPYSGRSVLRYYRTLLLYLELIKLQFTHARTAVQVVWKLGLPAYVHDEFGAYYRVKLTPPFLNYCYLPLAVPPAVYQPFGTTKLCALGMEANTTNTTSLAPWGHLLSAEHSMDRPEVGFAILMCALLVAMASSNSSSTSSPDEGNSKPKAAKAKPIPKKKK